MTITTDDSFVIHSKKVSNQGVNLGTEWSKQNNKEAD